MAKTTPDDSTNNPLYDRALLADMLAEAAELEHSLCCQYLFAAFSMKRTVDEGLTPAQVVMVQGWQSLLMEVARQEMEHLGYVMNLQIAIGSSPHLRRPNLPLDPQYYETGVESTFEKFSRATMQRFVLFELPEKGTMAAETLAKLKKAVPFYDPNKHQTIGELYDAVTALFEKLDGEMDLFVGPPGAQFKIGDSAQAQQVHRSSESGLDAYNVKMSGVTDLASAKAAIDQIVEEGEGSHGEREDSHFGKFLTILSELEAEQAKDRSFDPARNVVSNPRSNVPGRGNADKPGKFNTTITNDLTNEVSRAFDQAYTTLLLLLMRFFGATDQPDDDSLALENAAFFPFMTMVIRPLAEVLTTLPATPIPGDGMAGPSFRFERRTGVLGERDSAFDTIGDNIEILLRALERCSAKFEEGPDELKDSPAKTRIDFMIENVWRIHANFISASGAKELRK